MHTVSHDGIDYNIDNLNEARQLKEIIEAYYDKVLTTKHDRHAQMGKLFPQINEGGKILDYGCGLGGIAKLFSGLYNCRIDAVDISQEEIEKARLVYGDDKNINFILLKEFDFPREEYDLVFSSQVIEHVHNVGNYLSNINNVLKPDGILLIGLPNIVNLRYLVFQLFMSNKQAIIQSQKRLKNYNKVHDHINGWDAYHFITLLASCGFELVEYLPTEGIPLPTITSKFPRLGMIIPRYIMARIPLLRNLSYTMFFVFKKKEQSKVSNYD